MYTIKRYSLHFFILSLSSVLLLVPTGICQEEKPTSIAPITLLLLDCTDGDQDGYFAEEGCGTPVDCDDSRGDVNPDANEDCNDGIDNNCDGQTDGEDTACFGCIDISEPNDTCSSVSWIGTVPEGSLISLSRSIYPAGDRDYYRFYAEEGFHLCLPGTTQIYTIRIRLIPPQGVDCIDYTTWVYFDDCLPIWKSIARNCNVGIFTYTWYGVCGGDDSRYFRVEVIPDPLYDYNCTEYTLEFLMYQGY